MSSRLNLAGIQNLGVGRTSATGTGTTGPKKLGWYPDVRQPGHQRYWDGDNWTEETRVKSEQAENDERPAATGRELAVGRIAGPVLLVGTWLLLEYILNTTGCDWRDSDIRLLLSVFVGPGLGLAALFANIGPSVNAPGTGEKLLFAFMAIVVVILLLLYLWAFFFLEAMCST